MSERFEVLVGAGTFRTDGGASFPHRWTDEGVSVETVFTGGHLLNLAAAGCVLNDLYREAANLGIDLAGVRVSAVGGFDTETWQSTGITYTVELDSAASLSELDRLLEVVDTVAEIPRALRAGMTVGRG